MNSCVGKKKKTSNKVLRLIIIQRRNSTFFFFFFFTAILHCSLKKFYNRDSSIIHPFDWLGKLEKQSTAGYLQFSLSRGSKRVPPTVEYFRDAGIVRTPFDVHSYVNLSGEPN